MMADKKERHTRKKEERRKEEGGEGKPRTKNGRREKRDRKEKERAHPSKKCEQLEDTAATLLL